MPKALSPVFPRIRSGPGRLVTSRAGRTGLQTTTKAPHNKLLSPGRWIQGTEYTTNQFSEEAPGEMKCRVDESALVGVKCYGDYCDNKELICVKISNITWQQD